MAEHSGGECGSSGDDPVGDTAKESDGGSAAGSEGSEDVRVQKFQESFGGKAGGAGAGGAVKAEKDGGKEGDGGKGEEKNEDAEVLSDIHSSDYEHLKGGDGSDAEESDYSVHSAGGDKLDGGGENDPIEFSSGDSDSDASSSSSETGELVVEKPANSSWQEERRQNQEAERRQGAEERAGADAGADVEDAPVSTRKAPRRYWEEEDSSVTCRCRSSARVKCGTSLLVLQQGFQYKLNAHLLLNILNDVPSLTRTELGVSTSPDRPMALSDGAIERSPRLPSCGNGSYFISHKVFLKSFCNSQFPHKSVIYIFILVIVKDESTDLWGS